MTKKLSVLLQRPFGPFDFSVTYSYQQILLALFFALLWHMFFLIRVYSLFLSLRIPLSFLHVTWMASLVLFVQVIPVSFSGIGVRETAYAYLFKIQNLPPENGALIGILLFSQILFMSCIGALLELSSKD